MRTKFSVLHCIRIPFLMKRGFWPLINFFELSNWIFILDHDLGHLCLLDVSIYLDILTLEFSVTMGHLPFWPGCQLILRPLPVFRILIVSLWHPFFFVVVICDAEKSCSMHTSLMWVIFSMSHRGTFRPLYFWYFGSNSEFLRWQVSFNDAKCTILHSSLSWAIFFFVVSDFRQLSCWNFLVVISLRAELQWLKELIPFLAMWSSWFSCGVPSIRFLADFVGFNDAYILFFPISKTLQIPLYPLPLLLQNITLTSELPIFSASFQVVSLNS